MAKVYILSSLPQDDTPYGIDFLANSVPFPSREAAEQEAQNIHNSMADLEDHQPGYLPWKRRNAVDLGIATAAWEAETNEYLYLIREFVLGAGS